MSASKPFPIKAKTRPASEPLLIKPQSHPALLFNMLEHVFRISPQFIRGL